MLALARIAAELLLMSGKGGKASAFGDPAVHGPKVPVVRLASTDAVVGLTGLVVYVLGLSFSVVCCVGRQCGW